MVQTSLLGSSNFPCPQWSTWCSDTSCSILPSYDHGGFSFLPALLIMLRSDSCLPLEMLRQLSHWRRQTIFLTNGYCGSIIISRKETLSTYYPNKYKVTEKQNPDKRKPQDPVFCKKVLEGRRRIMPPELFNLTCLKRLAEYSWSLIMDISSHSGETSDLF